MCGRLSITDSPGVRALCDQMEIALWPDDGQIFTRFARATQRISVVFERDGQRIMRNAIWWLLLDKTHDEGGRSVLRPSKYTSFNTRYDKLNTPRSAGYQAFRQQRCAIPVRGFGESQKTREGMHYHDMVVAEEGAMAMGGLYRVWDYTDDRGERRQAISCSVVTLPPHPKLQAIHQKSTPLMLSETDGSLDRWLDAGTTDSDALNDLLTPCIRHPLNAVPIDRPSSHNPIGESFTIQKDR
ncbi:SOS response-associated peptidase family protein [Alteromonas halophila]|uniref:Abasic site processing protein n=1 Tax=Alteromonas halophila TaxID=516698 RepID=A0A918JLN3_9ALTE|nr:SOS response-associated peptidase family protein [Alteromonas halophila]GGW88408.1 hypothetical protein GCM10007391_22970 [Alteromonas halophila]